MSPIVYLEPDPRGTKDSKTGFTTGAAIAHRKQLVKTSAYLRWGGYARQKGHSPVDLITPTIWLAGKEPRQTSLTTSAVPSRKRMNSVNMLTRL